jgi:hypothetical protein
VSIPDPFEQDDADAAAMAGFLDWVYDEPLSIVATQAERISTLEALTDQLAKALRHIDNGGCEHDTRNGYWCERDGRTPGAQYGSERMCDSCIAYPARMAYEADKEAHR